MIGIGAEIAQLRGGAPQTVMTELVLGKITLSDPEAGQFSICPQAFWQVGGVRCVVIKLGLELRTQREVRIVK